MERLKPKLTKSHLLSAFMGGLEEEIRLMVRMLKPRTLLEVVAIA